MFFNNRAMKEAHHDEPWLKKRSWAKGRIRASLVSVLFPVCFTGVWSVLFLPFAYIVFTKGVNRNNGDLIFSGIIILLTILNICMIVWALAAVARWFKYGRSTFVMASVPGVIGGQLAGVICCPRRVDVLNGFRVKLCCVNNKGVPKSKKVVQEVLWEGERFVALDMLQEYSGQTAIPVLFQIPYNCHPTDAKNPENVFYWQLEVFAKTFGLEYYARFSVPVFKTPQSDPDFEIDESLVAQYMPSSDDDGDLREAGILRTPLANGKGQRFLFPMGRRWENALALGLLGLVFLGVAIGMWYWSDLKIVAFFASLIFGLFGFFVVWASALFGFYKSTIEVSADGMAITGGLFGIGRRRWIGVEDVEGIEGASDVQEDQEKYYDITLVCKDGRNVTIGRWIPGRRLTTSIICQIEEAMEQGSS